MRKDATCIERFRTCFVAEDAAFARVRAALTLRVHACESENQQNMGFITSISSTITITKLIACRVMDKCGSGIIGQCIGSRLLGFIGKSQSSESTIDTTICVTKHNAFPKWVLTAMPHIQRPVKGLVRVSPACPASLPRGFWNAPPTRLPTPDLISLMSF
jgi:hypothetical protein